MELERYGTYTADELTCPDARRLIRWYLHVKISREFRGLAKRWTHCSADLEQFAVLHLLSYPPPRRFKLSTVCARAVWWAIHRLARKNLDPLDDSVVLRRRHYPAYKHDFLDPDWDYAEQVVEAALGELPQRELEVVSLLFGFKDGTNYSLEDVGRKLKVSRERVRQIQGRALRRLRDGRYERELAACRGCYHVSIDTA